MPAIPRGEAGGGVKQGQKLPLRPEPGLEAQVLASERGILGRLLLLHCV